MIKRYLVTGGKGFVGGYMKTYLKNCGYKVILVDLAEKNPDITMDVTNRVEVMNAIEKTPFDYVIHLAGFSNVRQSYDNPELCRRVNVEGTRNLLDAIRQYNPKARILIVTSAHVYGNPEYLPIDEKHPLKGAGSSPYADSRIEQEELVKSYDDLDWVISRSFNHTGFGQPLGFVVPDFVAQIREIMRVENEKKMDEQKNVRLLQEQSLNDGDPVQGKSVAKGTLLPDYPIVDDGVAADQSTSDGASLQRQLIVDEVLSREKSIAGSLDPEVVSGKIAGGSEADVTNLKGRADHGRPVIKVGNLSAKRDISDVRDVVRAYVVLLTKGARRGTYNVCSGKAVRVADILERLVALCGVEIGVVVSDERFRNIDILKVIGSNKKLERLGWRQEYDIMEESLHWCLLGE